MTRRSLAASLAAAWTLAGALARAAPPTPVEYWYAEANEGSSSGGHVALRLGADVFHYQQQEGLLRLLRADLPDFLHEYALAGNRSLWTLRLALSDETAALLRAGFETRLRAVTRQLERLAALRADRELLEHALRDANGAPRAASPAPQALALPAAGFFFAAAPAPAPAHADAALVRLRARIEARHGAGFVALRLAGVRSERARLVPVALPALGPLGADSEPPLLDSFAARHADLAAAQTALELLRDAPPLRAGSLLPADPDAHRLDARERAALCALREPLSEELVALAGSPRSDWGGAFLLGAARLLALEACCARGELWVLDAFAGVDAPSVAAPRPGASALLVRDASAARAQARARLASEPWDARRLSELETLASRAAELRRAARSGRLRVPEGRLLPARPALRLDLPAAPVSRRRLAQVLATAREREREAQARIVSLHAYHLTAHNCVTEIVRTLNHAVGDSRAAIEARLGGFLDPDAPGLFVPFVSLAALRAHYRVEGLGHIPSLRAAQIERLAAREGRWRTLLRELSPLSARSYTPAAADSRFLFFSDRAPPLRPLFGAANLAAGAGEAFVGLLRAPFDGGGRLASGLRGMFWSVPELFFFSVRKGTNEYVDPAWIAIFEAQLDGADASGAAARPEPKASEDRSYAASTITAIDASVSGAPRRQ